MKTCLPTKIRLSNPAELISALPYLVGFFPRDSLVAVCLHGPQPRIGLAVRADLPPRGEEERLARSLVAPVVARHPVGVMLIVVGGGPPHPLLGLPGAATVSAVSRALDDHGVVTMRTLWAESLDENARWWCYERCCGGRLPNPGASQVAAATTAAGLVTFADRDELHKLVAPDADDVLAHRGLLLDEAVRELEAELSGDPDGVVLRHLTLVHDAVEAAGRGELRLTDEHVVRLAVALTDRAIRDQCLRLCRGDGVGGPADDRAAAAERLWLELTRATPPPELANPATLAAFAAYLRGNGALAGMAVERALQAWPGHDLASLLGMALETGLPPEALARLADDAAIDAEQTIADDAGGMGR
jgi:hypothetical protein